MRISRISVYQVTLPLEHPYWLSGGRLSFDKLDSTIVAIDTDEGLRGWGRGNVLGGRRIYRHLRVAFARGSRNSHRSFSGLIHDGSRSSIVPWTPHFRGIPILNPHWTWPAGISSARQRDCRCVNYLVVDWRHLLLCKAPSRQEGRKR